MARERLDKLMVDRGLAASRERARALVMSGAVLVGGQPETKPGTLVDPGADIVLREQDHPYVSRGALKLIKALDEFAIDPSVRPSLAARAVDSAASAGAPDDATNSARAATGMVCLDIGASTGGFTDVLLRRGAARVYAIDVGYGQLAWSLRQDPRVVVLERQNARNMDLALVPEPCDLAVIDVSFISLTLVLPRVVELLRAAPSGTTLPGTTTPPPGMTPPGTALSGTAPGKPIIALVKPQFEVGRDQVGKGGVVRDEAVRRSAVDKVRTWAAAHGLNAGPDVESPITGPAGNVEYLLLLRTT